jgi:hypothetical protein
VFSQGKKNGRGVTLTTQLHITKVKNKWSYTSSLSGFLTACTWDSFILVKCGRKGPRQFLKICQYLFEKTEEN